MKVLPGSSLKLPKAKKPKGLYSNEAVTTNIYKDEKDKGRLQHVQMFVCHETGFMGSSANPIQIYSATKKLKRKNQAVKELDP